MLTSIWQLDECPQLNNINPGVNYITTKMFTFQNRLSLSAVVFEDILSNKLRMVSHK